MSIGFKTEKQKAEESGAEENSPQADVVQIGGLQADTYERLSLLGNAIMHEGFSALPMEQKEAMLNDFAYYKSVADTIS